MTIAIVSNVALAAIKPIAINVARQVGTALGFGALAGVSYLSIRASVKTADAIMEKFTPTPVERVIDADRRARRLQQDLDVLTQVMTARETERATLAAKLDLAETTAKTLGEQLKALQDATPAAPAAAPVATPSAAPRPRAAALKTVAAPKRSAPVARTNGSARAA